MLFDDSPRVDLDPARYSEPHFRYLNRSARPEFSQARRVLNRWFTRYPASEQYELKRRFECEDDLLFDSAFFELYLHELLLRLGFNIEVHPSLDDSSHNRTPDFLCTDSRGSKVFVEATVVYEGSRDLQQAQARINQVYDTLNGLESPNFFVGIVFEGAPDTPPPGRQIRTKLERWLRALDPDAPIFRDLFRLPEDKKLRFEHEGWSLEFVPVPKKPEERGKSSVRPVGFSMPEGFRRVDDSERLRDGILDKANRYGDLPHPYVIAINPLLVNVDRTDEMEALLGQLAFEIDWELPPGRSPRMSRQGLGVFTRDGEAHHRGVSGVLIGSKIFPWSLSESSLSYYHNPWAGLPTGQMFATLDSVILEPPCVRFESGLSPARLLGLASES